MDGTKAHKELQQSFWGLCCAGNRMGPLDLETVGAFSDFLLPAKVDFGLNELK